MSLIFLTLSYISLPPMPTCRPMSNCSTVSRSSSTLGVEELLGSRVQILLICLLLIQGWFKICGITCRDGSWLAFIVLQLTTNCMLSRTCALWSKNKRQYQDHTLIHFNEILVFLSVLLFRMISSVITGFLFFSEIHNC